MGTTTHGIKYPEMTDLPNVPDDIGGLTKLDQTTQSWFTQLDTTNLASLATQNGRCATTETSVTTTNASITTAVNRQAAQQTSVNSITSRNDSINTRLNARDTSLSSTQATTNSFAGQISALQTRGRGLLGYTRGYADAIQVAFGGSETAVKSITFNDSSPNASRVYRAFLDTDISMADGTTGTLFYAVVGFMWASGTTYPGGYNYSTITILDSGVQFANHVTLETTFTGITASRWTLWAVLAGPAASGYFYFNRFGTHIFTLEDVGLQL